MESLREMHRGGGPEAKPRMGYLLLCLWVFILLSSCEGKPSSAPKEPAVGPPPKVVVEREKGDKVDPLPPEVRIKLKRDGKENYSWEITGSDVNEILRVNEKLRRTLGGESQKER